MIDLNNTIINIKSNVREKLKALEELGYLWIDGTKPTSYIPEEDAKFIIIERNKFRYTCKNNHGYPYRDATEDLLINKKDLYND